MTMKSSITAVVAAITVTLAWAALAEDAPATKAPATCPMMADKAKAEQFANPLDKSGSDCGSTCTAEMKKNPEACPMMKNAATCPMMKKAGSCRMKKDAAATTPAEALPAAGTEKAQEICPIMGGKINKDLFVDYNGKRIYVCCEGCIDAVKKDPALYLKKMQDAGVTPAATPEPAPAK